MFVWWYTSVPLTCQIIKHPDAVHMTEGHHSALIDYPALSTSCHTQSHATTHFILLPSSNRSDQSKHTCADGGGDEEITVEDIFSQVKSVHRFSITTHCGCANCMCQFFQSNWAIRLLSHKSSSTTSDVILEFGTVRSARICALQEWLLSETLSTFRDREDYHKLCYKHHVFS